MMQTLANQRSMLGGIVGELAYPTQEKGAPLLITPTDRLPSSATRCG
jgi:hypothetical protein